MSAPPPGCRGAPALGRCREILAEQGVPPHIRRHSEQVARVAGRLVASLRAAGNADLDPERVEAAALLHDVAKAKCLDDRRDHAAEGARLLRELGFPEVARLVERHVLLGAWDGDGPVTEAEVLNYSDKRVRHEEVVSLEERFADLIERYGVHPAAEARIRENWRNTEAVEEKIFRSLPFGPDALSGESAAPDP